MIGLLQQQQRAVQRMEWPSARCHWQQKVAKHVSKSKKKSSLKRREEGSSDTLKYIIAVSLSKCIKSLGLKFLQIYQCRKTRNQCPMCVFWTQFCIFSANWDMCQVCPCLITDLVSIDTRFYHWMNICVNLLFIVTNICRSIHLCQFILSILRSAVSTDSSVNHCQS